MSLESVTQFFQEQGQDPSVQQQLGSATDQGRLVDKVVELGQKKGYSFTAEEVADWVNSITAQTQSQSSAKGELCEEELESLAGGTFSLPLPTSLKVKKPL